MSYCSSPGQVYVQRPTIVNTILQNTTTLSSGNQHWAYRFLIKNASQMKRRYKTLPWQSIRWPYKVPKSLYIPSSSLSSPGHNVHKPSGVNSTSKTTQSTRTPSFSNTPRILARASKRSSCREKYGCFSDGSKNPRARRFSASFCNFNIKIVTFTHRFFAFSIFLTLCTGLLYCHAHKKILDDRGLPAKTRMKSDIGHKITY